MTTTTTSVKQNLRENTSRLTAGERNVRKTLTMSKQDRFIRESEFKLMLTMIKGLKEENRILREDLNSLQVNVKDIKAELQYIRNHTQLATNIEFKECQSVVTDTKDTIVHNENQPVNIDFALPLFDENTINPVFHLKQLDNYMEVRGISKDEN
jgi:hypothetical protein